MRGATIPEPFDENEIVRVCEALRNQPGFQDWYQVLNRNRQALRYRELGTQIAGISTKLEDLSPAADVHATRYVNAIQDAEIILEVAARGTSDAARNTAQRWENFCYTFLNDIRRQRTGGILAPYRRHLDDMASLGAGFLHIAFAPEVHKLLAGQSFEDTDELVAALADAFDKGFTQNPIVVECPALETVFFEPDLSTIAEIGERKISDVLAAYDGLKYTPDAGFLFTSDTMPEFQSEWDRTVTVYHLETPANIYEAIRDTPYGYDQKREPFLLERRPNVAGRPWYTITPGHMTNHPDPSKRFQPLIGPIYPIVQLLNVTGTLLNSGALNTGRPMYQRVPNKAQGMDFRSILEKPADQRPLIVFDPSQSVLKDAGHGMHWELIPAPDMKWVVEARAKNEQDLDRYGFPMDISPEPSAGSAESGYQSVQNMQRATRYLNPALENTARSIEELLRLVGDIIKGLGVDITIPVRKQAEGDDQRARETITVKPNDAQEQDIEVRLEWVPATAQISILESDTRQLQLGLMSMETFMRKHYRDPLAERERIQIDRAKQFAEQKALETVQMFIEQNSAQIAAQVAAEQKIPLPAGLAPQSGGPAVPGQPRLERPPDAAMPGAGAPRDPMAQQPPEQAPVPVP